MVILSSSLSSIHGPWLGRRDHQKQQSGNTTGKQRWFICITWPIWMAHISEKAKNYGLSFPRFSIYIYIYIYLFVTWMHADLWFHEDHRHILPTEKKGYLFIFVSNLQGSESSRCLLSTFVLRLGKSYACKWEERTSVSPCLCIFGHRRPADNGRQWAQQGSKGTSPHVRRAWFQTHTLWLCQNSYWKWPFIVDLPIKHSNFP